MPQRHSSGGSILQCAHAFTILKFDTPWGGAKMCICTACYEYLLFYNLLDINLLV